MRVWVDKVIAVAVAVVVMTVLVLQVGPSSSAWACDPVPTFWVVPEYVAGDDLNAPSSEMVTGYQDHWDSEHDLVVLGGYVIETVHTLEPEGDWTRGSVSAVVETWGEPPADIGPFLHETVDTAVTGVDSCGFPSNGPRLGTREVVLATNLAAQDRWQIEYVYDDDQQATAALTRAFGEPSLIDRDREAEELMIARLGNARSGSGRSIAIAFGVILVVGGVLSYRYRKKRLLWQWDQIKAEHDAAVAGDDLRSTE